MRQSVIIFTFILLFFIAGAAQKQSKPWTEWSKSEVEHIPNDSAWGQTQLETDTSYRIDPRVHLSLIQERTRSRLLKLIQGCRPRSND